MKKILFLLMVLVILFFDSNVYAICDTADIDRLKQIAKNVEITYEHNVYGDVDSDDPEAMLVSVFDFTVAGMTDELYIMDDNQNAYYMGDAVDGVINFVSFSGERKIYIRSKVCDGEILDTRSFSLPVFNFNSLSDECKKDEFKDLDICAKFVDEDQILQADQFNASIEEIESNSNFFHKLLNFVKENALVVSLSLIGLIVLVVIFTFKRYKRSVLE